MLGQECNDKTEKASLDDFYPEVRMFVISSHNQMNCSELSCPVEQHRLMGRKTRWKFSKIDGQTQEKIVTKLSDKKLRIILTFLS